MPYSTYMKLTNEMPAETDIRLSLASHSSIYPLGIVEDVLVEAAIKIDKGTITLRSGNSKISFNRVPNSPGMPEKGVKNDIEPIAPTMTVNRLVLKWEEKIKLHLEREMEFNQWRRKNFKGKHPTLITTKGGMKEEGEVTIWKAFRENTRDLGSFGEETDKTTVLHQNLLKIMLIKRGDDVASIKRLCHDLRSDNVNTLVTPSEHGRPKGTLEDSVHEGYRNAIELPDGAKVSPLRSDTIRLVQNGCEFYRLMSEDPIQHLKDFLIIVDSIDLNGATRNTTRLHLFCFSLRDQAINWLDRLPARSISTWDDLTTRFLAQFFPPGRTAKLQKDILMFQQHQNESLCDAWTRFKDLL
ncbi:zinc finger, CCHC-type containing protein [Tanacetum coccineum]|uniref:Zinc finger, CCHC-type containing protein n=1 Tax=Tanacetum coccineum TaxID=301880 RepID=A0ABQ5I8F3_9ASTR